jgi:hypothetical protein
LTYDRRAFGSRQFMTDMPTRGLIQFACFCAGLVILLAAHRHFLALNNFLGLFLFGLWIVLGIVALIRAYGSAESPSMPTLLGALPRSWRKWFTGD